MPPVHSTFSLAGRSDAVPGVDAFAGGHAAAEGLPMVSQAELVRMVDRALADCRRRGTRLSVLALEVTTIGCVGGSQHGREPALQTEAAVLDTFFQRLRGRVRHVDQVLRLDHRMAAVILPGAGNREAQTVEARLAGLLHGMYRQGDALLQLQLLAGHATYPELGVHGRELVLAATRPLRGRMRELA